VIGADTKKGKTMAKKLVLSFHLAEENILQF